MPEVLARDWLESGVVALSGFMPPGAAATKARQWSKDFELLATGRGHAVRLDGARLLAERAALTGARADAEGRVSVGGSCRLVRCSDGWLAVSLPRPSDFDLLAPLIERPVGDPWGSLMDWASESMTEDVVARGRLLGIALSRVGDGALPFKVPAPPVPAAAKQERAGKVPLVIDFSALWAGPLCASLLGLAGARVVKVESSARLDGARLGEPRFYDLLHAGHESLSIDPQAPADRKLLQSLVRAADVVIESSRRRALAGWGLSAAAAVAEGTVWVSITAHGRGQPDRIGFGDDVAAGAGLVGLVEGAPRFVGDAIADPLTGLAAAVATLRVLGSGRGQLLDVGMASVVASTLDGSSSGPAEGLVAAAPTARNVVGRAAAAGANNTAIAAEFS